MREEYHSGRLDVAREAIDKQLKRHKREADVFLFPTLSDAFGLTQLECMAWRLPLIASRHCGDVVRPGVNGLRLAEVSAASITEAVKFCLHHPGELSRWSAGCQVPEDCSMASFGQALLDIEERLFPARVS